ncbi:hypothetical protein KXW58_007570 [Aspergillus fumigatus]|nr:hypothetical protein KXW58_007570 [Aspergillus fumigatus]
MAEAAIAGALANTIASSGMEAWKTLNKWLQNREIALSWYASDYETFTDVDIRECIWASLFCDSGWRLKVNTVFTIAREDWESVIKECLPVCHTWYRIRIEDRGQCCWLHLFRSVRDKLGPNRVLQAAGLAFNSLGIIGGLPAARLDSWGLVVLAYSNGAKLDMMYDNGAVGFSATLDARNFVLSVSGKDLSAPLLAHLEPKEHPDTCKDILSEEEIKNLLLYGHSFRPYDIGLGWPLFGGVDSEPPPELVDGRFDEQLQRCVLSNSNLDRLKERFRQLSHEYTEKWLQLVQQQQHSRS